MLTTFRTPDHPKANSRIPQPGEREYVLTFPHENGDDYVEIKMGHKGYASLCRMIEQMRKDDEKE